MTLPDGLLEKACGLATGCIVAACGGDAVIAAGAGAAVAGVGLLDLGRAFMAKHGLDNHAALARVRRRARQEIERSVQNLADLQDLAAAEAALDQHLKACMPDRDALAAASFDEHGFPSRATQLVLTQLGAAAPEHFSDSAPEIARRYASTVIEKALHAAVETPEYFALLEPHIVIRQGQFLARLDRLASETRADVAEILALLRNSQALRDVEAIGTTEAQIIALLTRFVEGGLTLEQAQAELPKAARLLQSLSDRLRRLGDDEPEIVSKLNAANAAISSADLDRADLLLAEAEAADLAIGEARILRAVATMTARANLAEAQARRLEAADLHARAAEWATPIDKDAARRAWIARTNSLIAHAAIHPGLGALREAVESMRRNALPLAASAATPVDRAEIHYALGEALSRLGARLGGAAGLEALEEAVDAYATAEALCPREHSSFHWAKTREALGEALTNLAENAAATNNLQALDRAMEAFADASDAYAELGLGRERAEAQRRLGRAITALAERKRGEDRLIDLNRALDVLAEVQTSANPDSHAFDLGTTLIALSQSAPGDEKLQALDRAYTSLTEAFDENDRTANPVRWAVAKANVAIVLALAGEQMQDDTGLRALEQAIADDLKALDIFTEDSMPADWVSAQLNLGGALYVYARRIEGDTQMEALKAALIAHTKVLAVITRTDAPALWAEVKHRIGSALIHISQGASRDDSATALRLAVEALSEALEVLATDDDPTAWCEAVADRCFAQLLQSLQFGQPEPVCSALSELKQALIRLPVANRSDRFAWMQELERLMTKYCRSLGGDC